MKYKISDETINNNERMKYVEKWANYVINNKDWSKLQKELIDSQIENVQRIKLTKKQVEKIKMADCLS